MALDTPPDPPAAPRHRGLRERGLLLLLILLLGALLGWERIHQRRATTER